MLDLKKDLEKTWRIFTKLFKILRKLKKAICLRLPPENWTKKAWHKPGHCEINENVDTGDDSIAILWPKHPSKGFVKAQT